jgi:hypothetical protein
MHYEVVPWLTSLLLHDNCDRECASRCEYVSSLEGDEEGIYLPVFSVMKSALLSEEDRVSSAR